MSNVAHYEPWIMAQAAMVALGIDGLVLTGVAAQETLGGHHRIRVYQSDPPGPGFVLSRTGAPHVCTPDPDGAQGLPPDHVHPIAFDSRSFARALPAWLGAAATGTIALDRAAPGAIAMVEAACPDAKLVDAGPLLFKLDLLAHRLPGRRGRDPDDLLAPRRRRADAAAAAIGADSWWFRTHEAVRMVTGRRELGPSGLVGDTVIADADLDATVEHLPARGRLAVDRLTITERQRLRAFLPNLEIIDAAPIVLAGSIPRSAAETAALREGYHRTECAIDAARFVFDAGASERQCAAALRDAGTQLGLDQHIDHVVTVIARDHSAAPWLRGEWQGHTPWRQLTTERVIEAGDLVAVDAGFFYDGYTTDFGATFVVDREPTPAEQSLANRWTDVADRVTEAMRPGATAADLRAAAIAGWDAPQPPWPFGLYVAHGVGFGGVVPPFAGTDLGVEVERTMVLEPGDVMMIEPYIYESGVGGYRAERSAAVTDTGSEIWSTFPVEQLSPLSRV